MEVVNYREKVQQRRAPSYMDWRQTGGQGQKGGGGGEGGGWWGSSFCKSAARVKVTPVLRWR